ncbi:hypothetical protein OTB20_22795 [Streptomyces sp. H27-H1]|uniref:hypothetical protein n=1 Tax=Streptomyces sp. H27-H1 TaxID=2996461 RepID=UPI00226EFBE6|nr:hypothetical protein [Streptomyces sp. H27-H1]MCY0928988.1 hypothetical protein [Streptomyces sp. H27-H1]
MSTDAHFAPPAAVSRRGTSAARRVLLAGVGFAVLFIGGVLLSSLLGTGTYPSPLDSEAAAASYFAANRGTVLTQGIAHVLAAVPLAMFAGAVGNRPARAAGWTAAAALAASGLLNVAIGALDFTGDTLHTLHYLTFLAGGQLHVPLLGILVAAGTRARAATAPRWTTALGLVAAGLAVLSLVSFATEAAMLLLPLGRFTAILWIVITAVRTRRGK